MQGKETRNRHGLAEGKWPTLDQFRKSNLLIAVAVFKWPSAPRHLWSKFRTQCD